jgi:hypothetical protein
VSGWSGWAASHFFRVCQNRSILPWVWGWFGRPFFVSTETLGLLLSSLSDSAELDDPSSLTRRITPGDTHPGPAEWEYELVATRYPIDHSVVLLAKVRLPVRDLTEVVARLRRRL